MGLVFKEGRWENCLFLLGILGNLITFMTAQSHHWLVTCSWVLLSSLPRACIAGYLGTHAGISDSLNWLLNPALTWFVTLTSSCSTISHTMGTGPRVLHSPFPEKQVFSELLERQGWLTSQTPADKCPPPGSSCLHAGEGLSRHPALPWRPRKLWFTCV